MTENQPCNTPARPFGRPTAHDLLSRPKVEGWSQALAAAIKTLRLAPEDEVRFRELTHKGACAILSISEKLELEKYQNAIASLEWLRCQARRFLESRPPDITSNPQ